MLKIQDLHVSYGAVRAIKGISLEVNDGELVSLIGANTAPGIVAGAFLFGILRAGGNSMQRATGVPVAIISVIQAVVILMVVATGFLREGSFKRKKSAKQAAA